jgi:hypothetical protein
MCEMEKNSSIRASRTSWENGINEELIAIAAEKQRPFVTLLSVLIIIFLICLVLKVSLSIH